MASLHEHDEDDVEKRLIDVADPQGSGGRRLVSGFRLGALVATLALGSAAVLASRIGQLTTRTSARQFEEKDAENGMEKHAPPSFFGHHQFPWVAEMKALEHAANGTGNHAHPTPVAAMMGAVMDQERKAVEEAVRAAENHTWNQTWNQTHHHPCPWAHAALGARNHAHHGPCPWASEQAMEVAAQAAGNQTWNVTWNQNGHHPCPWAHAAHGARNPAHPCPWASEMRPNRIAAMLDAARDAENARVTEGLHPVGGMGAMTGNHAHQIPLAARMAAMEHAANVEDEKHQKAMAAIMGTVKDGANVDAQSANMNMRNHAGHNPFAAMVHANGGPKAEEQKAY